MNPHAQNGRIVGIEAYSFGPEIGMVVVSLPKLRDYTPQKQRPPAINGSEGLCCQSRHARSDCPECQFSGSPKRRGHRVSQTLRKWRQAAAQTARNAFVCWGGVPASSSPDA